MGAAASSSSSSYSTQERSSTCLGTVVNSNGEVDGIPVAVEECSASVSNQGADDTAGHGSLDYIWRVEGLTSRREDNGFRCQFNAKGLEWELSLLLESCDKKSVSVRLSSLADATSSDAAKFRLTYVIVLFNQSSCGQNWTRSEINAFPKRDAQWGFKDFMASHTFMDPSSSFVVDGSCELGVKVLRVGLFRVKKESLLVVTQHRSFNHEHTWIIRNLSSIEHQCILRDEFEATGCRWSMYLQRIAPKLQHFAHPVVMLFLSLDATTGHKKSITANYQLHVKGLASGYELLNAYTNVFVPGQCHGQEIPWSFDQDTCTVRLRLTLIGYTEAKSNNANSG